MSMLCFTQKIFSLVFYIYLCWSAAPGGEKHIRIWIAIRTLGEYYECNRMVARQRSTITVHTKMNTCFWFGWLSTANSMQPLGLCWLSSHPLSACMNAISMFSLVWIKRSICSKRVCSILRIGIL